MQKGAAPHFSNLLVQVHHATFPAFETTEIAGYGTIDVRRSEADPASPRDK